MKTADLDRVEQQTMHSSLGAILRRAPVSVPLGATLQEALKAMSEHRIGSIVIADQEQRLPLGIFTLRDLLRRIVLEPYDLDQPIATVMTGGLVTLRIDATAYQAVTAMAKHRIRHIVVVDADQRLAGVVSQNDLFALQRTGVNEVSREILEASDMATLERTAAGIRELTFRLLLQDVGADSLMQLVSTLNDLLTYRLIDLTLDRHDVPEVDWCWIALGSEGRFEQTLASDQDNGIIFEAADAEEAQRFRDRFLPFAREVNERLDDCGYPLCKGNIMASNPRWCLSLAEWTRRFSDWIEKPEAEALLNASIFFDFRPLFGRERLSDALREFLLRRTSGNAFFLRFMVENALQCQPPLGFIRDFVFDNSKEFPHTIDLKMYGTRPFVDAARIIALGNGIAHTNTAQRLRAAAEADVLRGNDVRAIVNAFFHVQGLRLQRQRQHEAGQVRAKAPNRVDPDTLNDLDRQMLKEVFKQARKLQTRLQLDYRV